MISESPSWKTPHQVSITIANNKYHNENGDDDILNRCAFNPDRGKVIMKKIHKQYNDIENLKKRIQVFDFQELNRK